VICHEYSLSNSGEMVMPPASEISLNCPAMIVCNVLHGAKSEQLCPENTDPGKAGFKRSSD
jgi:hypothetical protein